jgi:hypothetical protein
MGCEKSRPYTLEHMTLPCVINTMSKLEGKRDRKGMILKQKGLDKSDGSNK